MTKNETAPIYLDYQATTPCDPRVIDKMIPYFGEKFGNPHSRNHLFGWRSEAAVTIARGQVADLIGADPREIVFTSGATESNNLALKGVAKFYGDQKNHIITCATEHKCVLDTCRHLEREGLAVTYLPVQKNGLVDLTLLEKSITPQTALVSIMAVNNEIGVIQPLEAIGALCRKHGVFFHTDAAQGAGKIPLDVERMNIDLMSLSSHKLYGPQGIGALYVRRKPRVRLVPLINGGGQERGMRSGTVPTALAVGFGEACALSRQEMQKDNAHIKRLQAHFLDRLNASLTEIHINGDLTHRVPGNLNISFAYVEGEGLMMGIKNLALSSGSACTSSSLESSYVLKALGVEAELAHTSLRIGFGRFSTLEEVDQAATDIIKAVTKLREMSPLWEMAQEGVDIRSIEWAGH